jgi:Ran GTPase-activating protein (RanGAP) involved in mRNA processing and transport
VAEALEKCPRLTRVEFKLCRISDEIVPAMIPLITSRIKYLNLSHNKITKDGFVHIAEKFKNMAQTGDPS